MAYRQIMLILIMSERTTISYVVIVLEPLRIKILLVPIRSSYYVIGS